MVLDLEEAGPDGTEHDADASTADVAVDAEVDEGEDESRDNREVSAEESEGGAGGDTEGDVVLGTDKSVERDTGGDDGVADTESVDTDSIRDASSQKGHRNVDSHQSGENLPPAQTQGDHTGSLLHGSAKTLGQRVSAIFSSERGS